MLSRARAAALNEPITRSEFFYGILGLGSAAAVAALAAHQIIFSQSNLQRANERRMLSMPLYSKRGTMYDRNGNVIVSSIDCKNVFANPQQINKKDFDTVVAKLVEQLDVEEDDVRSALAKDTTFVYIQRQVDEETAEMLEKEELPGIDFEDAVKRIYPNDSLCSQVIGVTNTDGEGITGLENYYEDLLHGVDGSMIRERAADGSYIAGGAYKKTPAKDGTDIVLTIDMNIQRVAEEALAERVEAVGAAYGSVVVMDPNNGEILAACSYPTFNPTDLGNAKTEDMNLRAVTDTYEPGSVFKPVVVAGGIESEKIKASTTWNVPASIKVGDTNVTDDDGRGYEMVMDPREIIRRSSNVGMVVVADAIGEDDFQTGVIERFQIGQEMGIDFPGESTGIVRKQSEWDGTTLRTMGFGQGISMPPIEVVRATAAIANGGKLVTPHFLKSSAGEDVDWTGKEEEGVISAETAESVREMMLAVVDEGTGETAQIAGYSVAGKTGTAQQADESGGYRDHSFMSSFIGYAPVGAPKVLCYVSLDQTALHGYIAGPAFVTIMEEALSVLGIGPDR